ncbi:glycosyltransferase family 1 protein [Aerococcus urinaeequi]
MNVLCIVTVKFGTNGISNVVRNYYKFLDKSIINMDFVLLNEPSSDFRNEVSKSGGRIYVLSERLSNPFKYLLKLNKILKNYNYDIVHAHGNSNTLSIELSVAKKHKVPVRIAHAHSTTTKFKILNNFMKRTFERSYTHGISCGIDAGQWLFGENNFYVIDNGVDTEKYKFSEKNRADIRNEFFISNADKVIGHVGHFSPGKNQKFIIELIDSINKIHPRNTFKVLLVGEGELRKELELLVKEKKLEEQILFLGNRSDVHKILSAFDLLIMPSIFEGLPLTLIEAQSADLSCFISDTITEETNVTGEVHFFNLNDKFVNLIKQINGQFKSVSERNKKNGNYKIDHSKYNIEKGAIKLQNLYKHFLENTESKEKIL